MTKKKAKPPRISDNELLQLDLLSQAQKEITALKKENSQMKGLIRLFVEASVQAGEGQKMQRKCVDKMEAMQL